MTLERIGETTEFARIRALLPKALATNTGYDAVDELVIAVSDYVDTVTEGECPDCEGTGEHMGKGRYAMWCKACDGAGVLS